MARNTSAKQWEAYYKEQDRVKTVLYDNFVIDEFLDRDWYTCRKCYALVTNWEGHLLYHDPTTRPYFIDPLEKL